MFIDIFPFQYEVFLFSVCDFYVDQSEFALTTSQEIVKALQKEAIRP